MNASELRPRFRVVCATGTNGKTTTTSLVEAIVREAGEIPARVTTLGAWVDGEHLADEATPEAFELAVNRAAERGVRTLAVETTSQALQKGFAAAFPPDVAIFTNLTRDHLDAHGTLEEYLAAKAQLFLHARAAVVLNAADEASALLREIVPEGVQVRWYAAREPVVDAPLDLSATGVLAGRDGTRVELAPSDAARRLGGELSLRMVGDVHAATALGAALAGLALGFDGEVVRRGLSGFAGVPGRFMRITDEPLGVVDYAHTPDALSRTISLARRLVAPGGRVLVAFGCGGDRDQGKRPEMGAVAAALADVVVLTSDNPRTEDPEAILDAILAGAGEGPAEVLRISDRRAAIERIISLARPSDIVVVAGKGHEAVQVVGSDALPFDDATVLAAAAQRKKGTST
ncbi:MAG: UDP-N-acetylmuramyl-tripeptide synthetase [Polyangiaceae bacterium]|nr:UDP-N-acetylmuramyl-tripeptide synthetase [Polyangiaceae bacterium]